MGPTGSFVSPIVTANAASIKLVTITGYLNHLGAFVNRTMNLNRPISLLDRDNREQDKVVAQVPKRKPMGKNFQENDPRIEKIQLLIREKTEEMLDPNLRRNHLLKHLPYNIPNILFQKSTKNLEQN